MSESLATTNTKVEKKEDLESIKDSTGLSSKVVAQYLQSNSEFFEEYPEVLGSLHLPDLHNSESIGSLSKKQLSVLRKRNEKSEELLTDFLTNARDNQQLISQSKNFVLKLLDCKTSAEIEETIEKLFDEDFDVEYTRVINAGGTDTLPLAAVLNLMEENTSTTRCFKGAIRPDESMALFSHEKAGSAIVISTASQIANTNLTPLTIAIGSEDANFYTADIGTEVIEFLVEVAAKLLGRLDA